MIPSRKFAFILISGFWIAAAQTSHYTGGCASSNCHGGTSVLAEKDSRILGNEYSIWFARDKHSKAYSVLDNDRSKRIAEILNLGNAQKAQKCLVCHAAGSPPNSISDGVACEACHGPAEKWLGPHTQPNSHATSVQNGMVDQSNLRTRTANCLSCHLGNKERVVDHEMIAAGHPDLVFELDTFGAAQPMHYREPKPSPGNSLPRVRVWAVGQASALAQGMTLLAGHATSNWPEFSDLECYQCHHDLRAASWRIQRGYAGRKPGSLQVNIARFEILRKLAAQSAGDRSSALDAGLAQVTSLVATRLADGAAIAQAAANVAKQADDLAERFARQDFDAAAARALVKAISGDAARIAGAGVHSAEQATMSLDALASAIAGNRPDFQKAIAKLYDYLEHPSTYQPAEFAAQFRQVAAMAE
ncbi:MAG: hypothetical protein HYX25_09400 [Candidatus Solibacter usitatus]|nr:hypothetical protein [Candidatus Solibacter usitatus]